MSGIVISENAFPLEVEHAFAKVDIDTLEDLDYANFINTMINDKK
ncbi:hypothetical protein [Flavobacterium sp. 81]